MVNNIDALVVQITDDKDPFKARELLNKRAEQASDAYKRFNPSKVISAGGVNYTTPDNVHVDFKSYQLAELMSKEMPNVEIQSGSGDTWTNVVFTYFSHIMPMNLEKPDIGIIGSHKYHSLANLILRDHANIHLLNNEKMSFLREDILGLVLDTSFMLYGAKERNPESHLRAICKYHPEVGSNPMKIAPYYSALKGVKALNSRK